MKDLDFDELDKAVNSLMTSVPKNNGPSVDVPEPNEKTVDLTAVSENSSSTPTPAAPAPSLQSPPRQAPPASRRSGRFMDVVHPSAGAKPSTPTRPASREGAVIQPRPSQVASLSVLSEQEPATLQSPTPFVTEKTAPTSDWPDPLEMTSTKTKEVLEPATPPVETPAVMPKESNVEPAPLMSPFLSDAKVEKRPLGSSAPTAMADMPSHSTGDEAKIGSVDDSAAQLPAMPSDTESQMPEELQDDLMAVEADTHMGVPKTDESHPLDTPTEPEEEEKKLEASVPPILLEDPAKTEEKPVGPPSIPQQYREEPNTGEKESGAIYDTDTYHQPLSHPAKKKSGWLWVLWILIILLVGAGGGAALYFFGVV